MFIYSVIGFFLSSVVHFSTVFGVNAFAATEYVFILHVGLFISFFAMIMSSRKNHGNLEKGQFKALLINRTPRYIVNFTKVIFVYAVVNFMYSVMHLSEGGASIKGGIYIIQNHGEYVRDISLSEYLFLKRTELRAFSGHWLVFYIIPAIYFRYANEKA